MANEKEFRDALKGKQVPILILDQKWHRLFAVHGKPDGVKELEAKLSALLSEQGKLSSELKEYKNAKNHLMDSIVQNMEEKNEAVSDSVREKKMEENRRLIDELNIKSAEHEDRLLELPNEIRTTNENLMLASMEYFYEKLRINEQESKEIEDWITQIRIDLKKNIIRKQNRDINNKEMYAYLHDVLGPEVLDMFDVQYEKN